MKILRVINSMDPAIGGPCQGIRNIIPQLTAMGITNEVVSLDDPGQAFINNDPFVIHAIGKGKGPWSHNNKLETWLSDNICNYDIVIVHGLWQYYGYAVQKAFKQIKRKDTRVPALLVMPHGMLDPYFQKAKGRKLKAIRNWFYWKWIEGRLINRSDALLFTCEEELRLARTAFTPYQPSKELNVGYGIQAPPPDSADAREVFMQKCFGRNDVEYLLFISRIHEKKGVDILINAYLKLSATNKNLPKLVIAGPGLDTNYGKAMKQLAAQSGDIYFPGMLTGHFKWGAFYGAEAFVLISHQENFGIAVAEAMACSKPVLISDKVNIWREISDGGGGLVETDDYQGALALLTQWSEMDQSQKENMGRRAKNIYRQFFGIEGAAETMKKTLLNIQQSTN